MSHIPFQSMGADVSLEADYVIVGSGPGGAPAGVTLARGGATVVVVEAGPWRDPPDYPYSVYGAMRDMMDDWGTNFTRGRAFWPIVQGSGVGGTSVINSAICVRTPADVFDRWLREKGVGGPAMAEAVWRYQDMLEKELCAEEVPVQSRGRSNNLAHLGADRLGYENHFMVRYVKGCLGDGQCLQGCRSDRKQSLNRNYIPEILQRGGGVLSSAPVKKILFSGNRAVAVTGRFRQAGTREAGASFTVRAKKAVLVAASVIQSPLILMRSGLKNPMIGKEFRSHPGTLVLGVYDEPVDMNIGATQGWASIAFREDPGFKLETLHLTPDMLGGRLAGSGQMLMDRLAEFRHLAMWVQATRAESVGEIKATITGSPSVHYTLDRRDMLKFRAGMHMLAKTHVAAGANSVLPSIHGMPYRLMPNEIDTLLDAPLDPQAYVSILSHLFGGCVMGADPDRSVCDCEGKVHGFEGLYVVDASVIPSNLGVNPQHTIMGLSCLFAGKMLAKA